MDTPKYDTLRGKGIFSYAGFSFESPFILLRNPFCTVILTEGDSAQDLIESINKKNNGGLHFDNWPPDKILFEWQHHNIIGEKLTKDIACFVDYLLPSSYDDEILEKVVKHIKRSIYSEAKIYVKFRWMVDYLIASLEQSNSDINPGTLQTYYDFLRGL
jgi:hypothetical protein